MNKIRFSVERAIIGNLSDVAYVDDLFDPIEAVIEQVIDDLDTDIMVTISDVTMHIAAWKDIDHWSDDWKEVAGDEDVDEFVAGLLSAATESGTNG